MNMFFVSWFLFLFVCLFFHVSTSISLAWIPKILTHPSLSISVYEYKGEVRKTPCLRQCLSVLLCFSTANARLAVLRPPRDSPHLYLHLTVGQWKSRC